MITAIFSDIHANLAAFESVLADAKAQGAQNFACLGDIVGYGPNPSECIALIQRIGCVCVKGNHDEDSSNQRSLDNLNNEARQSLEWTRDCLSEAQRSWLSALPLQRRLGRNLLVHSSEEESEYWHYIRNRFDAQIALANQKAQICFFGHTHVPVVYGMTDGDVSIIEQGEVSISKGGKYLINVGSVGQPRDGIVDSCYVLYDREKATVTHRRVNYNVSKVAEKINEVGLSPKLAERLITAA